MSIQLSIGDKVRVSAVFAEGAYPDPSWSTNPPSSPVITVDPISGTQDAWVTANQAGVAYANATNGSSTAALGVIATSNPLPSTVFTVGVPEAA